MPEIYKLNLYGDFAQLHRRVKTQRRTETHPVILLSSKHHLHTLK